MFYMEKQSSLAKPTTEGHGTKGADSCHPLIFKNGYLVPT